MVMPAEVIKLIPFTQTPRRLENCNAHKLDTIVGIVRAILNEEIDRTTSYIGLNIYRAGTRVFYARSYDSLSSTEFGPVPVDHFIEFEAEWEAENFLNVLNGILMLGITIFKVESKPWDMKAQIEEVPIEEVPSFPWFSKAA